MCRDTQGHSPGGTRRTLRGATTLTVSGPDKKQIEMLQKNNVCNYGYDDMDG